jgi:hypothetical protein
LKQKKKQLFWLIQGTVLDLKVSLSMVTDFIFGVTIPRSE